MSESRFGMLLAVAIALAGSLAYVNTLDGEWVWDDASSVLLHKHVQDPAQFFQLFREDQHAFGKGQGNFYRPLVSASFMLDFVLSHDAELDAPEAAGYPAKPLIFHLTNLLWHVAAALLLLALLTRLEAPRAVRTVATLLYVVHPLHTEAVAYISGRADMMSAAFMFAGLWFALAQGSAVKRAAAWAASALCFAAALLSKESSFIFPVLLALVLGMQPRSQHARDTASAVRFVPLGIAGVVLIIYGVLRMSVLKFADAGMVSPSPLSQRIFEAGQAFAFYLRALIVPAGLHMEQSLEGTPAWTAILGALGLAVCIAVACAGWRTGQRRIALGIAWFLAAWLPISGVFPLNAPMAEHWMYVPMAGFWWAVAEIACRLARSPAAQRLAAAGAFCLGALFLGMTVQRNRDWHDNERLFRSTLSENETMRVHYNLAVAYDFILGNSAGARRHYEAVLRFYEQQKKDRSPDGNIQYLLDDEIEIYLALGRIFFERGNYVQAIDRFAPVAAMKPTAANTASLSTAALGMGQCFLALGDFGRANHCFQQALAADPKLAARINDLQKGAPLRM